MVVAFSLKWTKPSMVSGTSSDRTKSSPTALRLFGALGSVGSYGLSPRTIIGVGLVEGVKNGMVLVSQCGPLLVQVTPLVKVKIWVPAVVLRSVTSVVTGQTRTLVPNLPRLPALKIALTSQGERARS